MSTRVGSTYFPLVTSSHTGCQDLVLDTTCSQMVQDGMVGHIQHTVVVFHWGGPVQDKLLKKDRYVWGCCKVRGAFVTAMIPITLFWLLQIEKEFRHPVTPMNWLSGLLAIQRLALRHLFRRMILGLGPFWQDPGRNATLRHLAIFAGLLDWNVVGADLDVIDQDICVVDSRREFVRELHYTVRNELDMMRTGRQLEDSGGNVRIGTFSKGGSVQVVPLSVQSHPEDK